jgi:DNA-binding LytR/AlgR family response regulator
MAKSNILIVEDESIVALDIKQSLIKLGYNVVGVLSSGKDVQDFFSKNIIPDLILMDIMIKGDQSGIEVAQWVNMNYNVPIVFLTAHSDEKTLSAAKDSDPYGYIIKPFKEVDLKSGIDIAINRFKKAKEVETKLELFSSILGNNDDQHDYIFVKNNSKFIKLYIADIKYIEALKDYVLFITDKEKFTLHITMKELTEKLPEQYFARVHRSFIVNLNRISAIDYVNAKLDVEGVKKQIPVGGSYKEGLLKQFKLI